MAETVIQLKRSTTTATPTSLSIGEPAYSYSSNTLFIGSPDGTWCFTNRWFCKRSIINILF